MPIDVQMPDGTIITGVPDNITQSDLMARYKAYTPSKIAQNPTGAVPDELGRYDVAKQPKSTEQPKPADAGFSAKDTAIALGQGVVGAGKSLADVFGAENTVSQALGNVSKDLAQQYTPERKAEMARREQLQKQASKGTIGDEIGAFLGGVAEAPVQALAQGLGSIAPFIGTGIIGGIAKLGGATVKAINTVIGTAQGAGSIKGSLYDNVKQELEKSGMDAKEASAKASKAQEYIGENFADIAFGALLGGAGARVGVESMLTPGAVAKLDAKLIPRMGKAALAEAPLEGAQGGQEQLAVNRALQKQGFDVGTFEGVAGAAARDAAIGALTGAAVGVRGPGATQVAEKPSTIPVAEPPKEQLENTKKVSTPVQNVPQVEPAKEVGNVWESIQNRDRSTPASIAQMAKIASEPDYNRVSFSRDFGSGAPIVVGNRLEPAQLGREDTVTGSDGKKIPIQYAVIDASEALASHNADGTKNPEYVQANVKAFRAITNGRVAGLQAAYRNGTAEQYKQALLNDDLHGIDKSVVEQMQNPMLVRLMQMQDVNKNIGDVSNTGAGLTFNAVEQAKNDTNRVDLSAIKFNENGEVSPQTVRDFVKAMPTTEQGNLIGKDGNPTKQAVDRLEAAIFQQAYSNDKLTELAFQAQDEEAKNIIRALNMAASKAIRIENAGDYDVRQYVNEAVELAINARRNNQNLKEVAKQADMTVNPLSIEVLSMFANNPRSAKAIGDNLSKLFDDAYTEANKSDTDMFGNVPKRPVDQLIRESLLQTEPADLFTQPEEEKIVSKAFEINKSEYEIHQEIKGLDANGLTKWLVSNAPNPLAKYINEKIQQQIKKFQDAGVKINIIMLNGKDRHKNGIQGTSGIKGFYKHEKIYFNVRINGLNSKGQADDSTIGYQILTHELLHTVSQLQIFAIKKRNAKDYQDIQKDLESILRAVRKQNREEAKKDLMEQNNASYQKRFYKNTDELFAYGLSNRSLQEYLSTIKIGNKTAFSKLVEIVRKLLGIDATYDTALDKLMRVGDRVFQMSTDEIAQIAKEANMNFGEGDFSTSAGTDINEAPNLKTNTPQFKKWFGNSKITNEDGSPKVMYHGTARDISEFKPGQANAIFVTDNPRFAERFSTLSESTKGKVNFESLPWDQEIKVLKQAIKMAKDEGIIRPEKIEYLEDVIAQGELPKDFYITSGLSDLIDYILGAQGGQNIIPVYVKSEKPFNFENPTHVEKVHQELEKIIGGAYSMSGIRGAMSRGSWETIEDKQTQQAIKNAGFDGFYVMEDGKKNLAVYDSNQIKSAIGNTGEYNVANPDITQGGKIPDFIRRLIKKKQEKPEVGQTEKPAEGRNYKGEPVEATWQFPEDKIISVFGKPVTSINNLIYKFQDKNIDIKRIQKEVEKTVGEIDDNINVYQKAQLYQSKLGDRIKNFLLEELNPAIEKIKSLGLTPEDVRVYLQNRHAKERNDKMNELNKYDPVKKEEVVGTDGVTRMVPVLREKPWALQDRASGISTDDAKKYLDNLDPAKRKSLDQVAELFDKMIEETQDILVKSGAETPETIAAWRKNYEHYVPLFRVEEDIGGIASSGASKGFQVRGNFGKRALGSEKEVADILGSIIGQRERALMRAEKIEVGVALFGFAVKNPNPDFYLPVFAGNIKNKNVLIEKLQGLGYNDAEDIVNNLMEEPKTRKIGMVRNVDPNNGLPLSNTEESVRLKNDNLQRFADNVFVTRIDGEDAYVFFNKTDPNAQRMVRSLKNLDTEQLGEIEGVIGKITRWFAAVNTQYNPIFGAVNLTRDVGAAMLNLSTTPLAGMQAKITAGIFPSMRGIIRVLRDERKGIVGDYSKDKYAQAFQEFRKEGGQTGYRDSLVRTAEQKAVIEKQLDKMEEGNHKKAFSAVLGALTDFNDMMENSIRLSAYVVAVTPESEGGKGLSNQKAAIIAKNLTVNFDSKGQLSARFNAYYAFFNASVQGTARLAQTLKGPMGKKIIAGGIGLGTVQAVMMAAAGYRDDEPPEFIKERNFIIPMPDGKFLSIPYPLGFNILPNIGRVTTEFVLSGGKNGGKKVANLASSFMGAVSPIGSSTFAQTIAPTPVDPIIALAENKDAFGRPIYREDRATNPTPGYMRSRESASEISKGISYFLNLASGGGKYSKGFLSPTADELDYLAGQVTGGVGRELIKTEQAIKAGITGEELPTYRIPLAGRFVGDVNSKAAESQRFYSNITRMAEHEHEVKGRQKNKENVMEYYRDHPEARFWQMANNVENQINALNKQKKEFQEKGLPKERIQRIDNQKAAMMKRFNDHIAKYEE
jgi:hypothetical protein